MDMTTRPAPHTQVIPQRVVLIGCAGSGKTTLARALAVQLGARHIERDALGDDEDPEFAIQVAGAVDAAGSRWVFDGAPYNAEMAVYLRADTVVALDFPRRVVQRRVLTRSVRLWLTRRADGAHTSSEPPWRWWAPTHPPSRLGHENPRRQAHRDHRAVRPPGAGPHSPATVHLAPPGHRVAGQPATLTAASPSAGKPEPSPCTACAR